MAPPSKFRSSGFARIAPARSRTALPIDLGQASVCGGKLVPQSVALVLAARPRLFGPEP